MCTRYNKPLTIIPLWMTETELWLYWKICKKVLSMVVVQVKNLKGDIEDGITWKCW